MIWHVIYADQSGIVQSRAARSSDHALDIAYELYRQHYEVRRIIEPDGSVVKQWAIDRRLAQGDVRVAIPPHSGPAHQD